MSEIKQPKIRFKGHINDWEQRKLGELGSVSMNKRIFKDETKKTGDVPFYKIGTFGGKPDAYISRELFEEYKKKYPYPEVGDILISASGSIGRTVVYQGEDEYFQDSNIVWLKHDERLDNSFLNQFYSVVKWHGLEGSTIKRLYNKNILDTEINLPSQEEQQKIGTFFKQLDDTISLHQQKLEVTKQFKQTMLKKMFPKNGETTPEIRFKGFTDGWEECKLGDKITIERGNLPSKTSEIVGKYPFFNTGSKKLYSNKYNFEYQHQVIVSGHGSVGNISNAYGKIGVSDGCYVLTSDNLNMYFLFIISEKYLSNHLNKMKTGTIISHTSKSDVYNCNIIYPKLNSEMSLIAEYFRNINCKIDNLQNKITQYEKLKQTMLRKLFI